VADMKETCRFCNIINGSIYEKENQLIVENNSFFSIASIGALVEGWVLIVPKDHLVSMKDLYCINDFIEFTNTMLASIQSQYSGQIIAFEHGPNKCGSTTSCGTNHAHLHLVPYFKSLYGDMLETGLTWDACRANEVSSRVANNEYLFYSEITSNGKWDNPNGYLHILKKPISQYFRRIIARQLDCNDEYDYKKYPRLEVAVKTSIVLTKAMVFK